MKSGDDGGVEPLTESYVVLLGHVVFCRTQATATRHPCINLNKAQCHICMNTNHHQFFYAYVKDRHTYGIWYQYSLHLTCYGTRFFAVHRQYYLPYKTVHVVFMHFHVCIDIYLDVYVCKKVSKHVCMYVCVYIYIYIYMNSSIERSSWE